MPPLWLAAALACLGPSPSEAPPSLEDAEQAFLAGDYARAAAGFAAAYADEPNPRYLYAQAQSERLAGNCAHALQLYDEFLALDPPDKAAADARANRARCATATPPPAPEVPPPPADTSPEVSPTEPEDDAPTEATRPWYRDPWGGALVGSGLFVGGIGIGLMINAARLDESAADAATEGAFETTREDARVRQRVGIGTTVAGAALLVGGVVRWTVVGVRHARRVAVVPTGTGLALRGRF
jgi:hypothetical protein